jgi:hypothetical protein
MDVIVIDTSCGIDCAAEELRHVAEHLFEYADVARRPTAGDRRSCEVFARRRREDDRLEYSSGGQEETDSFGIVDGTLRRAPQVGTDARPLRPYVGAGWLERSSGVTATCSRRPK